MSVSFSTIIQKARPSPVAATTSALREALARIPQSSVTKIPNGVRVASEENPNAKYATVGIWVEVGTKYDNRHNQGLAKVLQHCGFQGTVTQDRAQLARTVDELGGQLVVETGRELSFVSMKVAKSNVPKAVAFLSDVVKNARLSDADVAAAKKQVDTARHQSEELVDDVVIDNLHVCAFDATDDGGLGNALPGTKKGIAAVTTAELQDLRKTHYTGPRTLLVGAGAVKHEELETLANQYLGDLSKDDNKLKKPEHRYVGGDIRLWNLKTYLMHGAWAVETNGHMSGDTTVFQLLTQIHGNYHRSQHELGQHAMHRLFKTYSNMDFGTPLQTPMPEKTIEIARPFFHQYEETGLFGMYLVGRQCKTAPLIARSMSETFDHSIGDFSRLASKCVDNTELEQAKVNLKSQLLFNVDGSFNTAKELATQTAKYGRHVPLEEMYARIDDIEGANVQEVLQHYFVARKPVFSLYGYFYPAMGYDMLSLNFHKFFY